MKFVLGAITGAALLLSAQFGGHTLAHHTTAPPAIARGHGKAKPTHKIIRRHKKLATIG